MNSNKEFFICFICKRKTQIISKMVTHLKLEHSLSESKFLELKCIRNETCSATFNTYSGLRRHVLKCSINDIAQRRTESHCTSSKDNINLFGFENNVLDIVNGNQFFCTYKPEFNSLLSESSQPEHKVPSNFNTSVTNFASNLESLGLPDTTINKILSYSLTLIEAIYIDYNNTILTINTNSSLTDISEKTEAINQQHITLLKQFLTKYKRNTFFQKSEYFVKPIEIVTSTRWDRKYCRKIKKYKKCLVQNTFQYIPILETLKALFRNVSFNN